MRQWVSVLLGGALCASTLRGGEALEPDLPPFLGSSSQTGASAAASLWSGDWNPRVDWETTLLWADGIFLASDALYPQWTSEDLDLGLRIDHRSYELDYEPRIFGVETRLDREQWALAADVARRFGDRLEWVASAGYYEGFADYRSLWISEYYHQLFGGVPRYVDPSPKGLSISSGIEWSYIPVMAKVELTGGYAKDTIAPAYDVTEAGVARSRPNLYTNFLRVTTENVVHRRLVVQNTFQYTDTTDREKRWSGRTAWNWAVGEGLFLRGHGGGAVEQPRFDALFAGATLEWEWRESWFLRLTGRYYHDTGEIENALGGFSSAAPGLEAFEVGLGLRWTGIHSSLNVYAGYYDTAYGALSEDNAFLENLYRDRRWGLFQLAYTYTF